MTFVCPFYIGLDKLAQQVYEKEELVYWYKGLVAVPPLCMVDDILAVQKCSRKSVEMNAAANAFIELKKLTFSHSKCSKIHIGRQTGDCPQLKVHEAPMKESKQEKYLGDFINSSGRIKVTIQERAAKGYGIVSDILAILDEIPLGSYRLDMGLKLRQAKLINGMLYSSEGWHGVKSDDVKILEKVDEALLRALLQCHPKVPLEFLYLETGSLKISQILSSRRLMYLQTLLKRDDEELTKRILREQQSNPTPGDFVLLIKDDCDRIGMLYDENFILSRGSGYKTYIKKQIRNAAFNELLNEQKEHSKVRDINYEKFITQDYICSPMFTNDEVSLLAALRSHTVRGIRCNFRNLYKPNIHCPLNCWSPGAQPYEDTQEHLLSCVKLQIAHDSTTAKDTIVHNDIYGDLDKQKAAAAKFTQVIDMRNELLDKLSETED